MTTRKRVGLTQAPLWQPLPDATHESELSTLRPYTPESESATKDNHPTTTPSPEARAKALSPAQRALLAEVGWKYGGDAVEVAGLRRSSGLPLAITCDAAILALRDLGLLHLTSVRGRRAVQLTPAGRAVARGC